MNLCNEISQVRKSNFSDEDLLIEVLELLRLSLGERAIPIGVVRAMAPMGIRDFDAAVIKLYQKNRVRLFERDDAHVSSMERLLLLFHNDLWFGGIMLIDT